MFSMARLFDAKVDPMAKKPKLTPSSKWWNRLPEELRYLSEPAMIYLNGPIVQKMEAFVAELRPADLAKLAKWYMHIAGRGDNFSINRWLHNASIEDQKFGAYWPITCMLFIFEMLADKGVPPFRSGEVRHIDLTDRINGEA